MNDSNYNGDLSIKDYLYFGAILVGLGGAWYTTMYRIDNLEQMVVRNKHNIETNASTMVAHIQWELEKELKLKNARIKELEARIK